jgi:uncharacterized protein YozE (UPF0346 family)
MKKTYYEYMDKYLDRTGLFLKGKDCPYGDLAIDTRNAKTFPKESTCKKEILAHLEAYGACEDAIKVFKQSFRNYQRTCK